MGKYWLRALAIALLLFHPATLAAAEVSARGLVKAKSRAVLASEIGAVVNKTPFRSGDNFEKGDTLVGFDCRLLKSQQDKVAAQTEASRYPGTNIKLTVIPLTAQLGERIKSNGEEAHSINWRQ